MDLCTVIPLVAILLHFAPCNCVFLRTSMRCPPRKLSGGLVRLRSKGRIAKYVCRRGSQPLGDKYSTCVRGRWDSPVPICISRGCLSLDVIHGQILELYRGALVTVDCDPGYSLVGSKSLYCNGSHWNGTSPTCKEMKISAQKKCDFETEDLCGWTHDSNHDFDWRRHNFATPSGHVGTGPSYDHSLGPGLNGHYMYLETSSPRLENDTARLFSPVFAALARSAGPACFSFWYHMYGLTTGVLNVYLHSKDSTLLFSLSGNQGDDWRQAIVPLPPVNSSFQIVIEGVRGAGYEGDTAVDDVQLAEGDECIGLTTESVEESNVESSCAGRCLLPSAEPAWCECTTDCLSNNTCCLDFPQECVGNTSAAVEATTTNTFVTENVFTSNTLFKMRNTTTTDVFHKTTIKDQSSSSQSTVTTPLAGLTTSTVAAKTSTTTIAITTTITTPTLPATSVNPYNKAQIPTISPTSNKTNSPQSLPKLSNSSSTPAFNLYSTTTTKTSPKLPSTYVNPLNTKAQFPTISPIGSKNDSFISISKLLTFSPTSASKLSSITTTNTPPKQMPTSVSPFKTKDQLPTILPIGIKMYSPQSFPRMSTSSPKFSFKQPSTKSSNISQSLLSTSLHSYNTIAQFSTISPLTKKTDSSQSFPKLSTSILRSDLNATYKQVLTPTEPTAAQIVTSIVGPNLKSVKFDLNSSTKRVPYFHIRRPSTTQITTPYHSEKTFYPLTSKPLVLSVPSSFGNDKQKIKFLVPPPVVRFKSPNKSITTTAELGPRYPKTYTIGSTFTLFATTMSPKTMRNSSVGVPKSKNDVLHPKWKDMLQVPPPLPPLEPKPEVVVPGSETTLRRQTASSIQKPTTVSTSFSVKGWQKKSKYRQRVVGPVHAPVQAMPAAPTSIVHIVVLTCCGLLIIIAVLGTVCLVRKRKINRGNVEDDELDIRFLPPDEILDFTLARPTLEETQLCGGSS